MMNYLFDSDLPKGPDYEPDCVYCTLLGFSCSHHNKNTADRLKLKARHQIELNFYGYLYNLDFALHPDGTPKPEPVLRNPMFPKWTFLSVEHNIHIGDDVKCIMSIAQSFRFCVGNPDEGPRDDKYPDPVSETTTSGDNPPSCPPPRARGEVRPSPPSPSDQARLPKTSNPIECLCGCNSKRMPYIAGSGTSVRWNGKTYHHGDQVPCEVIRKWPALANPDAHLSPKDSAASCTIHRCISSCRGECIFSKMTCNCSGHHTCKCCHDRKPPSSLFAMTHTHRDFDTWLRHYAGLTEYEPPFEAFAMGKSYTITQLVRADELLRLYGEKPFMCRHIQARRRLALYNRIRLEKYQDVGNQIKMAEEGYLDRVSESIASLRSLRVDARVERANQREEACTRLSK